MDWPLNFFTIRSVVYESVLWLHSFTLILVYPHITSYSSISVKIHFLKNFSLLAVTHMTRLQAPVFTAITAFKTNKIKVILVMYVRHFKATFLLFGFGEVALSTSPALFD